MACSCCCFRTCASHPQNYLSLNVRLISFALLQIFATLHHDKSTLVQGFSARRSFKPSTISSQRQCQSRTRLSMTVAQRKFAIYDAAELQAIESFSHANTKWQPNKSQNNIGLMTIVTGKLPGKDSRVIGVQVPQHATVEEEDIVELDSQTKIYSDSMATIPSSISDADAISTYMSSLVGVHCTLPRVSQVGGNSATDDFVGGKVVVVGGSDYAAFAARGLAVLGANVTLVSNKAPKIKQPSSKSDILPITVLPPAVGPLKLGFSSVLGTFDSMLDTLSNEGRLNLDLVSNDEDEDEDDENYDYFRNSPMPAGSGVVQQLRRQHKCDTYVSTLTESQRIVREEGAIFGPSKAKDYERSIQQRVGNMMNRGGKVGGDVSYIVPPKGYATNTIQKLFDYGITYAPNGGNGNSNVLLRGWSFQDFWELASWPRDSASGVSVRFGFPVIDDIDSVYDVLEEDRDQQIRQSFLRAQQEAQREGAQQTEAQENPFVVQVRGVEGLHSTILSAKKDCVLFLSAPYCRTCKALSPQYSRMARLASEGEKYHNLMFAKADTSGVLGKELGRALEVNSVPSFVMFRQGRMYGSPLSISKLPSKKLEKAVSYLTSGREWDISIIRDEDSQK